MFSAVAWGGMSHSKCHPSFACNSVVYFNNKPTAGWLCLLLSVATDVIIMQEHILFQHQTKAFQTTLVVDTLWQRNKGKRH